MNPSEALYDIAAQLNEMAAQTREWTALHEISSDRLIELRAEMNALFDDGKDDEARALYSDTIRPLETTSLSYVKNFRYYALSALSLRQHILSGFYIRMKTTYIKDRGNPVYSDFIKQYKILLTGYEEQIIPHLVEADY